MSKAPPGSSNCPAPTLLQSRHEWTVRRWLTALPDELFPDRPVLSILPVGAFMVSGEVAGVELLLDGIERYTLEPGADTAKAIVFDDATFHPSLAGGRLPSRALSLIAGEFRTRPSGTPTRALELADPSDRLERGSAAALVGLAEWTEGDLDSGNPPLHRLGPGTHRRRPHQRRAGLFDRAGRHADHAGPPRPESSG